MFHAKLSGRRGGGDLGGVCVCVCVCVCEGGGLNRMLLLANRKPSFITLGYSRTGNHSIVCHIGEEGCRKRGCKTLFFFFLNFLS